MDGWMDGCIDGCLYGCLVGWMDACLCGRKEGRMYRWMSGFLDDLGPNDGSMSSFNLLSSGFGGVLSTPSVLLPIPSISLVSYLLLCSTCFTLVPPHGCLLSPPCVAAGASAFFGIAS